jgi:protein-L-isoaspartate(D-aspartate) O-methyltransferase
MDRISLIMQLRKRGIADTRVLRAMELVPREEFVDSAFSGQAYEDGALPIDCGQTISQPYTVAYQTQLLEVEEGDRILEVGTGSGYQAAVLCEMGARVFSIERHGDLLERARRMLDELGYRLVAKCGDGSKGWRAFAPFDGIVVTAGATEVPDPLLDQLREPDETHRGGRLVIPVGTMRSQTMMKFTRTGPESYETEEHPEFRFVPLVQEEEEDI